MVAVVELSSAPGMGASYARAVLGMLPGTRRTGDALPDVEMVRRGVTVDLSHLAAYDRVCGFRLSGALPATYPHVLAFPLAMRLMTGPGFPLPLIGLVHVANRITVRGPLDAGVPLDLSVRAVDLRDHPRGRRFDVVATGRVDGAEVWRGVSTYLRVTRPAAGRGPGAGERTVRPEVPGEPGSPGSVPGEPGLPGSVPGEPGLPGSVPGEPGSPGSVPGAQWRAPARVGADYAAVSGDRNPIHTSRLGARLLGFPRPIAHGMWTMARALAALEGRLPDAYTVDVAFQQPLLLPARATFTATPTTATPTAGGWDFALRSGRPHLSGSITPGLQPPPHRADRG